VVALPEFLLNIRSLGNATDWMDKSHIHACSNSARWYRHHTGAM